jgi:cytochrome c biogenesis protein CcdA
MSTEYNKKKKSPKQRFLFVIGLVIFLMYLLMGLAVIFMEKLPLNMEKKYKIALGILIIAYASFRFFRIVKTDDEE